MACTIESVEARAASWQPTKLVCGPNQSSNTSVRFVASALLILFMTITGVNADEPDLKELLEIGKKAIPFRDAWERCAAAVVKREMQSDLAPAFIAERALNACKREEMQLKMALARSIGVKQSDTVIDQLRVFYRSDLISVINQLRQR